MIDENIEFREIINDMIESYGALPSYYTDPTSKENAILKFFFEKAYFRGFRAGSAFSTSAIREQLFGGRVSNDNVADVKD